jgi:hypothetical protein
MDEVIIYTFGHLDIIKMALQALAVLFDPTQSEFFVSNGGMGLGVGATLAAMIAFIGTGFNWFGTQKFAPQGALYGIVLYSLFFVPKMETVWLSDLYTGRTEQVLNVPFGIAALGSAFSTISVGLTEAFEREYTAPGAVDGLTYDQSLVNGGAVGGNGFLSPLKVMLYFRHNSFPDIPTYMRYNILSYLMDCPIKASKLGVVPQRFNWDDLSRSTTPIVYAFNTDFTGNYDVASKDITNITVWTKCFDLAAVLGGAGAGSVESLLTDTETYGFYGYKATMARGNFDSFLSKVQSGASHDMLDSIDTVDNALSSLMKGGVNSQKFMMAALVRDFKAESQKHSSLSADGLSEYVGTMTTAVEQAKALQITEGSEFLHWSMTAMTAMQFLFYVLSPIVGIMLVAQGPNSFKYLGGYLLFGMWVYSWIPVAAGINFWSIGAFMEAFNAQDGVMGITPGTVDLYVEQAMTAVATGSNLLAMTPLITFALLSAGGAYAMTSLAQSANPKGGAQKAANMLAPDLRSTPPVANMKGLYEQNASGRSNATGVESNAANSQIQLSAGQIQSDQVKSSNALVSSAKSSNSAATADTFKSLKSVMGQTSGGHTVSNLNSQGIKTKAAWQNALSEVGMNGSSLSEEQANNLNARVGAGAGNKSAIMAIAGDIGMKNGSTFAGSKQQVDQINSSFASGIEVDESATTSSGDTASSQKTNAVSRSVDNSKQTGAKLEKAQQYAKQQSHEVASNSQIGENSSKTLDQVHTAMANAGQIEGGTWASTEAFTQRAFNSAADEAGMTNQTDRDNLWNKFSEGAEAEFSGGGQFKPGDRDSASALNSFWKASTSVQGNGDTPESAQENAILQDTRNEMLERAGAGNMVPEKNGFDAETVKSNVNSGGKALNKQVNGGIGGSGAPTFDNKGNNSDTGNTNAQDINNGDNQLKAGAPINEARMGKLEGNVDRLDELSNAITGNDSSQYKDKFESQRNELSEKPIAEGGYGKTYEELNPNQQRAVTAQAAKNTFDSFTNDVGGLAENTASAGSSEGFSEIMDEMGSIGKPLEQSLDHIDNAKHDNKTTSEPAEMQFSQFAGAFEGAVDNANALVNGAVEAKDAGRVQSQKKADIAKQREDSTSDIQGLMNGRSGVAPNLVGKISEEDSSPSKSGLDLASDFYQTQQTGTTEQANEAMDEQVHQANTNAENQKQFHANEAGELLGINSGPQSPNSPTNDIYDNHRQDYTAPQALAMTAYETGVTSGGDFSNLLAQTAGISGSGQLIKSGSGLLVSAGSFLEKAITGDDAPPTTTTTNDNNNKKPKDSTLSGKIGKMKDGLVDTATTAAVAGNVARKVSLANEMNEQGDTMAKNYANEMATSVVMNNAKNLYDNGHQDEAREMMGTIEQQLNMPQGSSYSDNNGFQPIKESIQDGIENANGNFAPVFDTINQTNNQNNKI